MKTILFVCIHNSARSQMAEAFMNSLGKGNWIAKSAGIEGGILNPNVVEAMKESGIDISSNIPKTVDSVLSTGEKFDYVVTVCDDASAERCPVIPGTGKKLHWSFPDPSQLKGSKEEVMKEVRDIRDQIKERISRFVGSES